MRQKPEYFSAVREEGRKRWNQLESDPILMGPWRLLFKQIQNPRHVLSELLQNADDSGATEASVDVYRGVPSVQGKIRIKRGGDCQG